jgi:hypothetical protein
VDQQSARADLDDDGGKPIFSAAKQQPAQATNAN